LADLCEAYYEPVFRFLRREGRDEDAARELSQEFFARVLGGSGFVGADRNRGRFRSFLLGAVKHFLADQRDRAGRQKRGGGLSLEPLDAPTAGVESDTAPGMQVPDPEACRDDAWFDRQWALALMNRALATLEREMSSQGRQRHFETLKPWLAGETDAAMLANAARHLGMNEGAVKVAAHRLRKRFREVLRAEIRQTLEAGGDVEAELRYLVEALAHRHDRESQRS
jgi:RNA polymerase sigma-70 factor (ECF subfamily)